MAKKLLTNQKETDRAIKAAVDQARKVLKYENTHHSRHRRTHHVSRRQKKTRGQG